MRTFIVTLTALVVIGMSSPASATAVPGALDYAQGQGQGQGQAKPKPQSQGQVKPKPQGQGQGQAKPKSQGQGQSKARGPGQARGPKARGGRGGPAPDRADFNRGLVDRAVKARGRKAGEAREVRVRREDGGIRFVRDDGVELFRLDADRARELGYWRAAVAPPARDRRAGDRSDGGIFGSGDRYPESREDRGGAPSFCRSGAGHPVWGRDWCLDKGFGLGDGRSAWGVDRNIEDIILRPRSEREVLDGGGLIDLLGDVVFGRLALQSLVLGADEPIRGRWLEEREGPRVLRVESGSLPVAELVDYERDGRVDRILFNLGG